MVKLIQPSMAGGEVSVSIGARVDLSKRTVAVETADNFIATFTGAMKSRPGLQFVAECKYNSGPYRIIDFEFNSEQTFVLELGDEYMRFHALGAQILDSSAVKTITGATQASPVVVTSTAHGLANGDEVYIDGVVGMTQLNGRSFAIKNVAANTFELTTLTGTNIDGTAYGAYTSGGTATPPYEIATPWAAADLARLSYAQSGDVLTIVHPDYTPREVVRIDNDTWTLSELTFLPDVAAPTNLNVSIRTTLDFTAITAVTQANPGVVTVTGHGWTTGDRVTIQNVGGMVELNGFLYEIEVLTANTISLKFLDGSVVDTTSYTAYTSGGSAVRAERPRFYAVTAVGADTEEESLRATIGRTLSITNITQADPCVVTVGAGHGFESLDDIEINGVVGMTELNDNRFEIVFIDGTSFSLRRLDGTPVDSTAFTAYVSGGTVNGLQARAAASADADWNNSLSWDEVPGAASYNVYATDNFGTYGFIGTTTKLSFEDRNLGPDYAVTPPILYNPFDSFVDGTDKQPGAVGFFQQRRIFANSNDNPNRFWMSQTGHFSNLSRSIPALDTDSIVASIAARRINEIKHIVPLTDLALLTSGGEYRVFTDTGVLTPSTLNIKPQSYYGSIDVRPIVAGDVGLFISPGQFIRDFRYQFADDKFIGKDITILARHLFDFNEIVEWDFAPSPNYLALAVRNDGVGLFLTYQPEQDVYAWTKLQTQGRLKSTCVIREGQYDRTYVLTERTVGTSIPRTFLERMDVGLFNDLPDAFCVDAGLSLDNTIATVTGFGVISATATTYTIEYTISSGHGLSPGDEVEISGIKVQVRGKPPELADADGINGFNLVVDSAGATTITVEFEGTVPGNLVYSSGGVVRKAVTTVSGLWHLEGATVVAAADGYSEQDLVVTNGSITLARAASRVSIGLPYTCRLVTLPLSTYGTQRPNSGKAMNVNRLTVQVERSMGMWFGPDDDHMKEAVFGMPALWNNPLPMVTQDIDVTMKSDWGKKKQVIVEQRDPLPLTILALIPDTLIGGN